MLAPSAALAQPDAALAGALAQEDRPIKAMLRQATDVCQDAMASVSRTALDECNRRLQVAQQMVRGDAVRAEVKKLHDAEFSVALAWMMSMQDAIDKSKAAIPVYVRFSEALDAADRPAKPKKKQ
ncbi:hypothetical protein ABNQ39_20860 [Azospirillum sp. A26]|uniref:hypothetical protein n=1 Tax=unclassified Azospirillum TaxID=2630922 RepID=UPI001B3BEEEF|nr:hypothetical protein [Azospirillum sp. TSA6c]